MRDYLESDGLSCGDCSMVIVGKEDEFEHWYREKFRSFTAQFGQFVEYERDIATRDIGLHLTEPLTSGGAKLTTCLCWFQMKGIMAETLSKQEAKAAATFNCRMKVEHLRFWFLQPMPTYLALYIESLDRFFILNLQRYIEDTWGRDILSLGQKTAAVEVPASSILDEDALGLIMREGTAQEWVKAMSADESHIRLCQRDYMIIWRIGTAAERKVKHRFEIYDWQSKTRGEVHIQERGKDDIDQWTTVRNHWQFMLSAEGVEEMYPHLHFTANEEDDDDGYGGCDVFGDDDEEYRPTFRLQDGQVVSGEDCAGEFHLYYIVPELNELGRALFELIRTLMKIKFIDIKDKPGEFISIAPWHARHV
jgi:hypothetical protein